MSMPTGNECIQALIVIRIWFLWFIVYGVMGMIITIPLIRIFNQNFVKSHININE